MGFPLLDIIGIVGKVVDKAIPDPAMKAKLQLDLATLADQENARAHAEMLGQIGTNTEEAKSANMFVAGWRPAVGWIGAVGLGYSFVVEPFADWIAKVIFHYSGTFPVLDTGQLMALVTGMLGFGTMRAVEKIKGVPDSKPLGQVPATSTVTPIAIPQKKVLGIPWPF
jgi:hypothetical protein